MPILNPQQLEAMLSDAVDRIRSALSPLQIYLYGSYAYGTPRSHSDIDLLVVVDQSPLTPYQRDAQAIKALSGIPHPRDVQVYTQEEFETRAALPVSFERTVKQKGRILYAA